MFRHYCDSSSSDVAYTATYLGPEFCPHDYSDMIQPEIVHPRVEFMHVEKTGSVPATNCRLTCYATPACPAVAERPLQIRHVSSYCSGAGGNKEGTRAVVSLPAPYVTSI
ncbi:hypothetical protein Pelo_6386 [Pelomyxa schiedti]|nr:hypothetical protein Pelo_6386 [Pelomyxa schiedti]